jgi:organic radical activating enzyme
MQAFNVDVNARQADYKHLAFDEVLVTSMFATIQGEGPLAGQCAVFLRLAGCNLGAKESCPWCDTYFELKAGKAKSAATLLTEASALIGNRPKLLVLTGGEPMLQDPTVLLSEFLRAGWVTQIETNGYFWSRGMQALKARCEDRLVVIISPKVNQRMTYPSLPSALMRDSTCLKILVDSNSGSAYHHPPYYAHEYNVALGKPVYVSPINHYRAQPERFKPVNFWDHDTPLNREWCRDNHRYAAQIAMQNGWRLSLQLHLFAELE